MLLLVSKSHADLERRRHPNLGRLVQPRFFQGIEETAASGMPWAADNDGFGGWDRKKALRYVTMLDRIRDVPGCRFVAVPDVVGDWRATAALFEKWEPAVRRRGLPVALVAQDGLEPGRVPWHRIDALFIGGTDAWKLSEGAEALTLEAKERGRWVHVGRVNGARRFRTLKAWETVDSVDGTSFSWFFDTLIADGLAWASAPTQLRIGGEQ